MKAVIQRVSEASVRAYGRETGRIGRRILISWASPQAMARTT